MENPTPPEQLEITETNETPDLLEHEIRCSKCGVVYGIGGYPFCPHGEGDGGNLRDEIPGGMWIENLGPVPIKVYSHTERLRIMKERGLEEFVRHRLGSPHTMDFAARIDPQTMANAKALVDRVSSGKTAEVSYDSAIRPFNKSGTIADVLGDL